MCGIVGMSFRMDVKYRKHHITKLRGYFTRMLVAAQDRGAAATGIVLMSRVDENDTKPVAYVLRSPLPASEFVQTPEYAEVISKVNNSSLSIIGHTRAVSRATARDNRNNHPFVAGHVIGVHNGVVMNDNVLWRYSKNMKPKGKCDSEVIFALANHLSHNLDSMETSLSTAASAVEGWLAIAAVSAKEPHRLFLLRDSVSPLELAWWVGGEVAIFGSKYSYMENAFKDVGMDYRLKRFELDPGVLTILDSTVEGNRDEMFIQTRNMTGRMSFMKTAQIVADNKEAFDISQGKNVNG